MMEEGYKIRNGVCQKEKYNIAQNESFVQIGIGQKLYSCIQPLSWLITILYR